MGIYNIWAHKKRNIPQSVLLDLEGQILVLVEHICINLMVQVTKKQTRNI